MPATYLCARLIAALLFGAAIGFERQWRQRLAGLRTNALVSLGSAMFVLLSTLMTGESSPTRMAAQVVSGIGFLGAGVIMRDGLNVRGLNTAATLWCASAVGALAGSGFIAQAGLGAAVVLAANVMLRPLAGRINRQPATDVEVETRYRLRAFCRSAEEAHVRALVLHAAGGALLLRSLHSEETPAPGTVEVRAQLVCAGRCDAVLEQVVARIGLESGVSAVSWEVLGGDGDDLECAHIPLARGDGGSTDTAA
jgi:putative Mg2+ transporter-C (MgtC) family protein